MVGAWAERRKISKLHWLKRPKIVTKKRNLDQKIHDSKSHIWSLSFNFRFSSKSLKANKNWQKRSLILQYRIKNILSQHRQNLTHFTNFPWNIFLVGVKKNIPLHSAFSRHRESKYLYIPVYLRKKMFVPET